MDGKTFAKIIEQALAEKGIKKGDFYDAVGISATALYGWKNGATPKSDTVKAIAEYLDLNLSPDERINQQQDETTQLLEILRRRADLRTLARSASDLQPSSVYSLIAEIEREKENERQLGLSD